MRNFIAMDSEKEREEQLDAIIGKALGEEPGPPIPQNFTELFIRRVERQAAWHELLTDFSVKLLVVVGSLAVFAGVYLWLIPASVVPFLSGFLGSWKLLAGVGVILGFTFFTDQVFLRYLFRRRSSR